MAPSDSPGQRVAVVAVALLGIALCLGGLVLIWVGPSLAADARSERLTGHGVDIHVVDRWPAPGSQMRLEVSAHGGSHAGIYDVVAIADGRIVGNARGNGVTWGSLITSGRGRGSETLTLELEVPASAQPGVPLPLEIRVGYVCAISGGGTFTNERFDENLRLEVTPQLGAALIPRAKAAIVPLLALLAWSLLCWGGAVVMAAEDRRPGNALSEPLGVVAIAALVGAALLGYWGFAFPVSAIFGAPVGLDWLLVVLFLFGPPLAVWRLRRDEVPLRPFSFTAARSASGAPVRLRELAAPLERAGYTVKQRAGQLKACKAKARLRVDGPETFTALSELRVRGNDSDAAYLLALALCARLGPLRVDTGLGPELVEPQTTLQQLQLRQSAAMLERMRRVSDFLRTRLSR